MFLPVLGFFVLFTHVSVSIISLYRSDRDAPLVTCYMVVLGFFGLYFLLPAALLLFYNSGEFIWVRQLDGPTIFLQTCLLTSLSLGLFQVGYWLGGQRKFIPTPAQNDRRALRNTVATALVLCAAGIALKLVALTLGGGFETSVTRLSGGLSRTLGVQAASQTEFYVRTLSGIADAGAVWLVAYSIMHRKLNLIYISLFLVTVGLAFLGTGKRSYLILPIIVFAVSYHKFVAPISIKKLPIASIIVLGFGFVSLMARIYLPLIFNNLEIDLNRVSWAQGSVIRFYFLSLEFATFEAFALSIFYDNQIVALLGDTATAFYRTNLEPLLFFVPRAIWLGKPDTFVDMSHAVRAIMVGGPVEEGPGIASTLLGTSWALGNIVGLSAAMLSTGFVAAFFDKNARFLQMSLFQVIQYSFIIVLMFQFFRQGTFGWTILTVLIQQAGLLLGFFVIYGVKRYVR
ncbi:MAG: hypothetical protein COA41_01925 [Sphingopyxis sp.]|nr:MAG: hypothetical protein COA41_01925 [Sphingopyxis sp.]